MFLYRDGSFYAAKEVSLSDRRTEQLEQEIALLSKFRHKNIVQYYGTDKDESKLYIFLELAKGSISDTYLAVLRNQDSLSDSIVSTYTRQILEGLEYLHGRNVIHRDIKCANILVHANGSVKLADFGLPKITEGNNIQSFQGSPYWTAPEVVRVDITGQPYGIKADIWSLGCTVLEMLTGQVPYYPKEPMAALYDICLEIPPKIPESVPRDARDFIQSCLQIIPRDRPTATELLRHPFVRENCPQPQVNDAQFRRFTL